MKIEITKQLINMGSKFGYSVVAMTAKGTGIWLSRGVKALASWEIRKLAAEQVISVVDLTEHELTVVDGTLFRIGDLIQIKDALDVVLGQANVISISANVLTYEAIYPQGGEFSSLIPVVSGKVEYKEDEHILDGQTFLRNTNKYREIMFLADIETGEDNLAATITSEYTPTQKKN